MSNPKYVEVKDLTITQKTGQVNELDSEKLESGSVRCEV